MDNYLNSGNNTKKTASFMSSNIRGFMWSKNSNNSISSFGNTTFGLKKRTRAVNALSLSLIGGMIQDQQASKRYHYN